MQIDRILGNVGVLYVGAYNSSTQYEYLNCVTYNGSSYVCVNQNGVTGVTPGTTNDWQLSAQKGDTGGQGIQGEQGIQGATGNGIQSIEKTSSNALTDTYTILFTDGSSTTFEVENGKGIVSIEKTSSEGNVDTYTITYNDDTTSTFTVTNGEVTNEELQQALAQERVISDGKYARALKTPVTDIESTQIYAENDVVDDLVINGVELTQVVTENSPSLDNPSEVQVASEQNIQICQNNYLNTTQIANKDFSNSGLTVTTDENGIFTVNGTNTNQVNIDFSNLNFKVKEGQKLKIIKISGDISQSDNILNYINVLLWDKNYNTISLLNINNSNVNYTDIVNRIQVRFIIPSSTSSITYTNFKFGIMVVNADDNIQDYQPYYGTDITIALTNSAIGQYADTIDRKNNLQNKVIQEFIFDGTEDWQLGNTKEITQVFTLNINLNCEQTGMCNYLTYKLNVDEELFTYAGNVIYIAVNKTRASTLEEFKTLLAQLNSSGNPLKIYLARVSPTTNPLSEEVQTALSNFKLYQDLNNVSIDGGSMSFIYNKSLIYTINQLTQLVQTLSSEVQALQTPTTEPTVETTSEVQADG